MDDARSELELIDFRANARVRACVRACVLVPASASRAEGICLRLREKPHLSAHTWPIERPMGQLSKHAAGVKFATCTHCRPHRDQRMRSISVPVRAINADARARVGKSGYARARTHVAQNRTTSTASTPQIELDPSRRADLAHTHTHTRTASSCKCALRKRKRSSRARARNRLTRRRK